MLSGADRLGLGNGIVTKKIKNTQTKYLNDHPPSKAIRAQTLVLRRVAAIIIPFDSSSE
jgi:hypothetical protein